jgi:hypothetical protein
VNTTDYLGDHNMGYRAVGNNFDFFIIACGVTSLKFWTIMSENTSPFNVVETNSYNLSEPNSFRSDVKGIYIIDENIIVTAFYE